MPTQTGEPDFGLVLFLRILLYLIHSAAGVFPETIMNCASGRLSVRPAAFDMDAV